MADIENALFNPNGGTLVGEWPSFTMVGSIHGPGESQYILEFARAGQLSFRWTYKSAAAGQYAGYRTGNVSIDLAGENDKDKTGHVTLAIAAHQVIGIYLFSQSTPPLPPTLEIDDVVFAAS